MPVRSDDSDLHVDSYFLYIALVVGVSPACLWRAFTSHISELFCSFIEVDNVLHTSGTTNILGEATCLKAVGTTVLRRPKPITAALPT
jgi:hypothetical protein